MSRFKLPKTRNQEASCLDAAVPAKTSYATKWATKIFREWQSSRKDIIAANEDSSLKFPGKESFQDLSTILEKMKFIEEVAKKDGKNYPPSSLYAITCGINRFLAEKRTDECMNILDRSDKRFAQFRKILDAEMKQGTRQGESLKSKKPDREEVTEEEEELMWTKGLLGGHSSKALMNTMYFYNGKLFGLRAGDHRNLRVNNFKVLKNKIIYDESQSKTFHGGLKDVKHTPRVVSHICHDLNSEDHSRCLVSLYRKYFEKVNAFSESVGAFYFKPHRDSSLFEYEKVPVGINSLNRILPWELCEKAGLKRKTAHSLRITLATKLFQGGTEEKLIRQRTGHRSDSLLRYERPSGSQLEKVSSALGPPNSSSIMPIHSDSNVSSCSDHFVGNVPNFHFNLLDDCGCSSVQDDVTDEILSAIDIPSSINQEVSEFFSI